MSKDIKISLTEEEAWVLFDLTRRFNDTGKIIIEDQAEERAHWNLCCIFEKSLHQESNIEYSEFIANYRERLRDE